MMNDREEVILVYGKLFFDIRDALFQADPIGINFATNTDEYDPEAGTIIPPLQTANSLDDVHTIVYEEFLNWFGEMSARGKERYELVSEKIWELWCLYKAGSPS